MKRRAIFFDRDNTLIASDGYLGDVNGVRLIPGAADAVARARKLGYATVVVSNQSGVARGLFNETAVHAVNAKVDQVLEEADPGAVIDRHEFCPFHPDAVIEKYRQDSDLRKPKPGMILRAARQLALDLDRSWLIGDAPRDIEAGAAAGCRTILFKPPVDGQSPAASEKLTITPDFTCTSLVDAIDFIERHPEPPSENRRESEAGAPPTSQPARESRTETLLEDILHELRRPDSTHEDFSLSRLLAGVMQILAAAVLIYAYFQIVERQTLLLLAIALQTVTISLLVMSKR